MMNEFENKNLENLEEEKININKASEAEVQNQEKFSDKHQENLLNRKEFYRQKDPIYYENEFGIDMYPIELYAGFMRRFFAFIVDALIAGAVAKIVLGSISGFVGLEFSTKVYGILTTVVSLLYFTISTYFTNGQTLGKMMLGLRVVSLNGQDLSFSQVLTREFFGRFIHTYGILFLLYLITAFTERKQNLMDLFADTSVIDLNKVKAYKIGQIDRENSRIVYE